MNRSYLVFVLVIIMICMLFPKIFTGIFSKKCSKEGFGGINRVAHLREFPRKIYMFWDKGWENAPYLAQQCYASWVHYNPTWEVIRLDDDNISQYISPELLKKINDISRPQHRADLIRVNLLNDYGGVWVDATIFCNKNLDLWLHEYMKAGIFYFKYGSNSGLESYRIGNWFIASEKNNYLMEKFCQKYNQRWKYIVRDEYFGFHKLFRELCDTNERFNNFYQSIPFYDARIPQLTRQDFYKEKIVLADTVNEKIKKIMMNEHIPMFKFRSRDKCPKNRDEVDGTVLQYIITSMHNADVKD